MWSLIRQHQFVSVTQCVLLSKQENIKMPLFDSETPPIQDQSDSENVGGEGDLQKAKYSQFQEIAYVNFLIRLECCFC